MGQGGSSRQLGLLAIISPGLLVAATGVGAGDLATAGLTGSQLGVTVLWAVLLGAFLKYFLTEGLARYQLATGQTLLEGAVYRLGKGVKYIFLPYLLLWSFFVGSALMSACGVATHAMIPVFDDPDRGKEVFGVLHSVIGVVLVVRGGFKVFEKVMRVCIAFMFVTVLATACLVQPDWLAVLKGLVYPKIPDVTGQGLGWTVALMGGVGGTLTVLCYGYWIREKNRSGEAHLRICRIDLAVAYAATAVFGMAMVIIGSKVDSLDGKGANLVVVLADRLSETLGPAGRWVFLIGAWGALFSSLLGVWQAVPYIFADFISMTGRQSRGEGPPAQPVAIDTHRGMYRLYLILIAVVPMAGVIRAIDFSQIQKIYAIIGAFFMPLLAIALLILNGRADWVGRAQRNRVMTVLVLLATLVFFAWVAADKIYRSIQAMVSG